MSSLVPGYMTVSWTVSPPAVRVRATSGVEGWPEGEMGMVYISLIHSLPRPSFEVGLSTHSYQDK